MVGRLFAAYGLVGLCLLLLPEAALAQQNAQLIGRVVDAQGLAVPGATIVATQQDTGYAFTAVSAQTGSYVLPNLPPGVYDVTAEISGFKTIRREGLRLTSGAEITLDWRLEVATVEEVVTITAESPLVETTSNRLGGTLSEREIDQVPANFRNFTALTQLIPGITPQPAQSTFEGGQVTANGSPAQSNLYLIDGMYNNDDRLGGSQGTQVRVVLDNISEYQVLGNSYSAEYGGAAGALINMVTRAGTNKFSGRVYAYFRDDALYTRSAFLSPGVQKPDERTVQAGFGLGGPIVRDRAHFYFTFERDAEKIAGLKKFPAEAAPLARDFVGTFDVLANNWFGRGDLRLSPRHYLSGRWVLETAPTLGEGFNTNNETEDAKDYEADWDHLANVSLNSMLTDRVSNVLRVGRIGEQLGTGAKTFFKEQRSHRGWRIGLTGRDQFAIGSSNVHPSYETGPGGQGQDTRIRTYTIDDTFSYFLPDLKGEHTFKIGGGFSVNRAVPRLLNDSGTFTFESDLPYNPANPATYPRQFEIVVGPAGEDFNTFSKDWRTYFFVEDRWRPTDRLTLNLGLRFDYQDQVPKSGNDFSPRAGVVYDLTGDGTTVIRGGAGRFTAYTPISVDIFLQQQAVITKFPQLSVSNPDSPVLRPDVTTDSAGNPGIALLSAAGQAELRALRDAILAGATFTRNPRVDSDDRAMPYQWAWSLGVARQLGSNLAVTVDYVGNASRDQLGIVDINEPVSGVRPGVNGFDPDGRIIPAQARGVNFARVLQYQTRPELNGDYKSLQVSVVKRFSNRWSMRHAYTLQQGKYVGLGNPDARRVWLDNDVRADYGAFAFDRRHVLAMSGTWNVWRDLSVAGVLSASSGRPINETTGLDGNRDADRNDRPVRGVDDATRPIVSEVDGQGRAVINGIDGPNFVELNLSVRYAIPMGGARSLDLFWDLYNLTNRLNVNPPVGNRASRNFMVPTSAHFPRQMMLGFRFRF